MDHRIIMIPVTTSKLLSFPPSEHRAFNNTEWGKGCLRLSKNGKNVKNSTEYFTGLLFQQHQVCICICICFLVVSLFM